MNLKSIIASRDLRNFVCSILGVSLSWWIFIPLVWVIVQEYTDTADMSKQMTKNVENSVAKLTVTSQK